MIGDVSRYNCPKCGEPLKDGPAATGRTWTYPLLGCKPCNAAYNHPDHPIPGLEIVVKVELDELRGVTRG